ncbi:MFS general substrate transporter [Neofusicoccum parvum]|uniref:MFS general substrate transporter n=1 Tax=Neofusicoccum parvum TaxID=310453 RepID=A0ACB5S8V8_9PEZI|nr:MFS general substrate transporter [Neofusicoccum parvum]
MEKSPEEPPQTLASTTVLVSEAHEHDVQLAYQWPKKKKFIVASVYCLAMSNSTLASSLPGGTSVYLRSYFSITDPLLAALPTSMYLVGYVVGPLFFAPLSERFGRKPMILLSHILFTCATLGCALSPSFQILVFFRAIAGVGGATPISLIGGVYSDLYADQRVRGRATAAYSVITTIPITMGPTMFGYVSLAGWRWSFYLSTIIAGCTLLLLVLVPETYAPILLVRKAPHSAAKSPGETNIFHILFVSVSRPIKMLFTEPIVIFSTMYVSLIFAVLFLFFQAYPFIFRGVYSMSPPTAGLALIPIGVGCIFGMAIFLWWDNKLHEAKRRGEPWSYKEEYQRLPLACGAGPALAASIFWLAWTCRADIHWIVPMLAGLPFGAAYIVIFIAFFNYLTDAYKTYSASAMAAASCGRSLTGALLVLAADSMYQHLGPSWATTVPALASLAMVPIPFVFIRYGDSIRGRSRICQELNKAGM